MINLDDFCTDDMDKVPTQELFGQKFRDWDDINVYEWDKFNEVINEHKKGCVVFGDIFPKSKLDFTPDFHIILPCMITLFQAQRMVE